MAGIGQPYHSYGSRRRSAVETDYVAPIGRKENGVSPENLLAIAMRSAEFNVANQLMNRGSKLCDVAFTPVVFPWPEDGPDTKGQLEK